MSLLLLLASSTADLSRGEALENLLVVLVIVAVPFAVAGVIDDLIAKAGERREREQREAATTSPTSLSALGRAHDQVRTDGAAGRGGGRW